MNETILFDRVVELADLGPLAAPVSANNGESLDVRPLADHPGWLVKRYRPGRRRPDDDDRLDRLIAVPDRDSLSELLLRLATSWPTSRVVQRGRTAGVLMPAAPEKFTAELVVDATRHRTRTTSLRIDWLAKPDADQIRRGLPPLTFGHRLRVCRWLVEVAHVLERHGLVYGDWSYANAFWSTRDFSAFVIDVDSVSFGARPAIASPQWEDPLASGGMAVDGYTDRYRVALLVARCLTGVRAQGSVLDALAGRAASAGCAPVYDAVRRAMTAPARPHRPPIAELLAALKAAAAAPIVAPPSVPDGDHNVAAWQPVLPRPPRTPPPPATPPQPPPTVPTPTAGVNTPARKRCPITGLDVTCFVLFVVLIVFVLAFHS